MSGPLTLPHHDGSEEYVLESPEELGETVTIRLRVPRASAVDAVAVRYVADGEPRVAVAEVDEERDRETWWRAMFPALNPSMPYRWLVSGGTIGYGWLTGEGLGQDVRRAECQVLVTDEAGEWELVGHPSKIVAPTTSWSRSVASTDRLRRGSPGGGRTSGSRRDG